MIETTPPRRIVVVGAPGTGKTTIATAISRRTGFRLIDADRFAVRPGWKAVDPAEFAAILESELDAAPDGWVVEGFHAAVYDIAVPRAELVVACETPWRTAYPRIVRRTFRRAWSREVLPSGNVLRWRDVFGPRTMLVRGITEWHGWTRGARQLEAAIPTDIPVTRVGTDHEVAAVIQSLPLAREPMRRVVVYGPSGSGKTTLARELARRLDVAHIELDALMHVRADWDDATPDEFVANIERAIEETPGGWAADGNYSVSGNILLDRADTAVWLRLPWRVVYPRLVKRTLRRVVSREMLWGVNRERWRDLFSKESMLIWGIAHWRPHHRKTRERLRGAPPGVRIVVLRSPREVAEFLALET